MLHNLSTYNNHGCRCDECRKANTDYQAARRRNFEPEPKKAGLSETQLETLRLQNKRAPIEQNPADELDKIRDMSMQEYSEYRQRFSYTRSGEFWSRGDR